MEKTSGDTVVTDLFLEFWSLSDPNVVWVLCGSMLLGLSTGVLGCFLFLQKRSLTGDALAHAALPGVTSAFMLFHSREPVVIVGGALISCLAGYWCVEYMVRSTKIKEDSALAIVLSLFFALGVFQLTLIQKSALGSQAGLDKLLFGQAAALTKSDVQFLGAIALALLIYVVLFFNKLKLVTFDRGFATALGMRVVYYELSLALAVVLSVVIGLQLVGVVLIAALLLTPPSAARYWSDELSVIVPLAGVFGACAGIVGANVSYLAPRMPSGPWMVVAISIIFFISLIFAPRRGLLSRYLKRLKIERLMFEENILRTLYKIGEERKDRPSGATLQDILSHRHSKLRQLKYGLAALLQKGLVNSSGQGFVLAPAGLESARKLTRYHRLWEVYLMERIGIAPDHVHEDAEEMEHVLNPQLEKKLLEEIDTPTLDPHGRKIPSQEEP